MRKALWIAGCLLGFLVILDQKFGFGIFSMLVSLGGHLLLGGLHYAWLSLPVGLPAWAGLGWRMLLIAFACAAWHCYFRVVSRRNVASLAGGRLPKRLTLLWFAVTTVGGAWAAAGLVRNAGQFLAVESIVHSGRGPIGQSISNGRRIGTALRMYSAGHQGNYPRHLGELVTAGVLTSEELVKINNSHPEGGVPMPWSYLPGLHESMAGDLPLLVSPSPINHSKYVVICNDTSTSLATAEQYQDALQKWRIASEESGAALQRTAPEPGGPKP